MMAKRATAATAPAKKDETLRGTVASRGGTFNPAAGLPPLVLSWEEHGGRVTITCNRAEPRVTTAVIRDGQLKDAIGSLFLAEGEWDSVSRHICNEVRKGRDPK